MIETTHTIRCARCPASATWTDPEPMPYGWGLLTVALEGQPDAIFRDHICPDCRTRVKETFTAAMPPLVLDRPKEGDHT